MPTKRLDPRILDTIRTSNILGIRAGRKPHRVIGIWAVVVERRVFVRSWSLKPRSWYAPFSKIPRVRFRWTTTDCGSGCADAQRTTQSSRRSRLSREVPRAGIGEVRAIFGRAKSRETTTELVPV